MSHVATRGGPSTGTPTEGSRTVLVQENQPREDENPREGVLRLRGGPRTHPRVTWNEDVIDNEGMGKKKSKICCIYHKPRRYDESSSESESESESSDSDSGRAQPGGRLGQRRDDHHSDHCHQRCHPHNQSGESSGSGGGEAMHDGGGSVTVQEFSDGEYEPNAFERQPGKGKGKGGTALDPNK